MRIEWSKYRVQLHRLGRYTWRKGIKVEIAWVPHLVTTDHDLLYITAGQGRLKLQSGWTSVRSGHCLWLRPGFAYHAEQDPDNPLRQSFFHFDLIDAGGRKRPANAPLPPEWMEPPDAEMVEVITRRIVDMSFGFDENGFIPGIVDRTTADVAQTLLQGLLMELDAASSRTDTLINGGLKPRQHRLMEAAAAQILEAPHHEYESHRLARLVGCSPGHFARLFRRHTGMNPEMFAIHARVHRAQRLLRETDLPVKDIATQLGYSDIYYFSRQFKQISDVSPKLYRERERSVGG